MHEQETNLKRATVCLLRNNFLNLIILLHHVKLLIIFQDYCHLYFAGDISKLGYLDEEMEQVHTLS